MKNVCSFFLFLGLVFLVLFSGRHYDGKTFEFGTKFTNTDSVVLLTKTTSLYGVDTLTGGRDNILYTAAIDMNPDEIVGSWTIKAMIDSGDAASDSIDLYVRLGTRFSKTKYEWGPWHSIWADMRSDSLYEKYIAQSDCSWFINSTSRQYKIVKRDSLATGDTTSTPYVTDFLH